MLCGKCQVEAKNALENYAFSMRNTLRDEKVCCALAHAHTCTLLPAPNSEMDVLAWQVTGTCRL